jgi:hypothetical protein
VSPYGGWESLAMTLYLVVPELLSKAQKLPLDKIERLCYF